MFDQKTRLYRVQLPTMTKPAGGGTVTQVLPKTGLLSKIYLYITATVSGTLSAPNAMGAASIIRQVRLTANSGIDIFSVSGPGFAYLLRDYLGLYNNPVPNSTARNAVTATTFNLDMVIPVSLNDSDPIGLLMLQNEQTSVTLSIQFEADATVATGATVTASVIPVMEFFAVPADPADYPPLNFVHQIIEDQQSISGAGDYTYNWARGGTYVQVLHGCGIAQSPADSWSRARLRVNQSNFLEDRTPSTENLIYGATHFAARTLGVIGFDFAGSSGLGVFAKARDYLDSSQLTDVATVITATGAVTLYTIRRQILQLG